MKKISSLLLLVLFSLNVFSQTFSAKYFGNNYVNRAYKTIKTSDGNLLTLAINLPSGPAANTIILYKRSLSGDAIWQKEIFIGDGISADAIIQTQDHNFVILTSGLVDASLEKGYDIFLIKVDQNGTLLWRKNYGGSAGERGSDVIETDSGDLVVAGATGSNDFDVPPNDFRGGNAWVFKTDHYGSLKWSQVFGGSENVSDKAVTLKKSQDGNIVVFGDFSSRSGSFSGLIPTGSAEEIFLFKLSNTTGEPIWKKAFYLPNSRYNFSEGIDTTLDGGFVLGALQEFKTSSSALPRNFRIIKVNSSGSIVWDKVFYAGGTANLAAVKQSALGNFVIAGTSTSTTYPDPNPNEGGLDFLLLSVDNNGNKIWGKMIGGNSAENTGAVNSLLEINPGEFVMTGSTLSKTGTIAFPYTNMNVAALLLFFSPSNLSANNESVHHSEFIIGPNPAVNYIRILNNSSKKVVRIEIYDVSGKRVKSVKESTSDLIDVSKLVKAKYILQIHTNENTVVQKDFIKK